MSKRKRQPNRVFKERRLPREVRRIIEQFAADHGEALAKVALSFGETIATPEFLETLARASPVQRSLLLVAMAETMKILQQGGRCDVCKLPAESFRYLCITPKEIAGRLTPDFGGAHFTGFALLCGQCFKLPRQAVADTMIETARRLQADPGMRGFGPRPAVLGVPVGEVGGLSMPARTSLETCEACGKTMWINQDSRDEIGERDGRPHLLCVKCAMAQADDIHVVPQWRTPDHEADD